MWEKNMKLGIMKMDCENGRWMKVFFDRATWWAVILVALGLQLLLSQP
jgi:hypothetical protein